MDYDDHIGFLVLAMIDVLAVAAVGLALMWAAVRDGRET